MMATGGADAFTSEQQASARHSFENWQQERQEEEKPASSFESYVDFVQEKQAEWFLASRRADKVRMRLGGEPGIGSLIPARPKGMHERTYQRLRSGSIGR